MLVQMENDYAGPKFEAVSFQRKEGPGIRIPAEVRVLAMPRYTAEAPLEAMLTGDAKQTTLYVHPEDVEKIRAANP